MVCVCVCECECAYVCAWVGGSQGCSWLCHLQQLFPSNPASPAPPPPTPSPHNETNTKKQEVPPINGGPIKAIIIPVSEFLQEIASQKICQLCTECGIIVLQVLSVFFFFFTYQLLLTKGHTDPSRPRALHTVTAVCSQGKPGTVFSGAGVVIVCAVKRAPLLCLHRLLWFPSWTEQLSF